MRRSIEEWRSTGSKNFKAKLWLRVGGLTTTLFAFSWLLPQEGYMVTSLLVAGLAAYQTHSLVRLMDKSNQELKLFLNSIRYDDFSQVPQVQFLGQASEEINAEFARVMKDFRKVRDEKEADYQYLKNIIYHLGIGVLSFDKQGEVQIINAAAKRLLKISRLRNIKTLEESCPELLDHLQKLRTGQNALLNLHPEGESVQLAIYAMELYLKGEEFKLVSIQNISSQLQEKEMEAWQNLIRVLTHEIMNSIAPISSLATSLEDELDYLKGQVLEGEVLEGESFDDLQLAVHTIKRRSEGLVHFVSDFRSLTSLPEPRLSHIKVSELFKHIEMLMQHELQTNRIVFSTHLSPEGLVITADEELMQQVLINLIKNAAQALEAHDEEGKGYKSISLIGRQDTDNRPTILVKDNGPGIDKDALERIFIPFFTTKKNGSGIGLSLSRQIMRAHKGTLTAHSKAGFGAEFELKF